MHTPLSLYLQTSAGGNRLLPKPMILAWKCMIVFLILSRDHLCTSPSPRTSTLHNAHGYHSLRKPNYFLSRGMRCLTFNILAVVSELRLLYDLLFLWVPYSIFDAVSSSFNQMVQHLPGPCSSQATRMANLGQFPRVYDASTMICASQAASEWYQLPACDPQRALPSWYSQPFLGTTIVPRWTARLRITWADETFSAFAMSFTKRHGSPLFLTEALELVLGKTWVHFHLVGCGNNTAVRKKFKNSYQKNWRPRWFWLCLSLRASPFPSIRR